VDSRLKFPIVITIPRSSDPATYAYASKKYVGKGFRTKCYDSGGDHACEMMFSC